MTDIETKVIDEFRNWVAETARLKVPGVGTTRKVDGSGNHEDSMTIRLYTDNRTWLEASIIPSISKIRVGLVTDSRIRNEEAEQVIEDSKESLDEFLELGMADAGYEDDLYKMEHFHESGLFYFATHLALDSFDSLTDSDIRGESMRLLEGYAYAFVDLLEE